MNISLFDYKLPLELIAQEPCLSRSNSRMLVYDKKDKKHCHKKFSDIVSYLEKGDVLVINDTKVMPARLRGYKKTGAKAEVLLLKEIEKNKWKCLVKPGAKLKTGAEIVFNKNIICKIIDCCEDGARIVEFLCDKDIKEVLDKIGEMPLPPYIKRDKKVKQDFEQYQTVYSDKTGAVAAPTAGLHFTKEILDKIAKKGVIIAPVTLHVGIGTFKPVEVENILDHKMHYEEYSITKETIDKINKAKKNGKRIFAVGTTSARVLESVSLKSHSCEGINLENNNSYSTTNLFIYPPYKFKIVDCLLTNFHLPKSTLLMLVSSLTGREKLFELYNIAIKEKYRFYSYGDCMLII
jgi:S-adenosylmethionine:tRNA ribosyltransferase-isomerase